MHRQAVQHAALAHRELGDVDHFLNFAVAFGLDLSHFERDKRTECIFVRAQRVGADANGFAAFRSRRCAPDFERFLRAFDDGFVVRVRTRVHAAKRLVRARIDDVDRAGVAGFRPFAVAQIRTGFDVGQAERLQNRSGHANSRRKPRQSGAKGALL